MILICNKNIYNIEGDDAEKCTIVLQIVEKVSHLCIKNQQAAALTISRGQKCTNPGKMNTTSCLP